MASCQFPAGIAQVSGTLSKSTIVTSKGIITRRVVAYIRNGKQKIYIREDKPRCSQPTAKEVAQRQTFGFCSSVSSLLVSKYHLGSAPKIRSLAYQAIKKRYVQCTERGMKPTPEFVIADIEAYAQISDKDTPKIILQKLKAYVEIQ